MYACTATGYRAVTGPADLLPGETLQPEISPGLSKLIAENDGRVRRSALLRASDWTQVADSPLVALERSAWASYRQQLRDLPLVTGFPDCPWPTPPNLNPHDADESGGSL
jgi:hypothetical protein